MAVRSTWGNGADPVRRMIGAFGATLALGATALAAGAGGATVSPPNTGSPPNSGASSNTGSAAKLYARAFADASTKGSAHETATIVGKDFRTTETQDASTRGGSLTETETASGDQLNFVSRLIGTKLWLKGDQISLEKALGFAAETAGFDAGYWIRVQTTSKYYASLTYGLNFPTSLTGVALDPPFTLSGPKPYDGQAAYAISSTRGAHSSASNGPQSGKFVLYVTATAKPLPITEVADISVSGVPEEIRVNFSHWGEKVTLAAPKGPRPV
jgi:hypothetical protein